MKFRFFTFSILFFLIQLSLNAQSYFDIANLGYEHATYSPREPSSFNINRFHARINLGIELKNKDYILGNYYGEIFKFSDIDYSGRELNLFSNFLSAGYLHFWKDREWSLLTQVRFKLNSDYFRTNFKDIQPGGWFLFTQNRNDKVSLFAGMYFNQEVNKNLIFPILGVHWKPSEKWNLYVLIPSTIRFEWVLKKNHWYTGLESDWTLNTYVINEIPDIWYFRKETLITSIFIEKHITEKIILFGKVGNYQINDYEAYDNSDALISQPQLNAKLIENLSFQAGFAYRMRL